MATELVKIGNICRETLTIAYLLRAGINRELNQGVCIKPQRVQVSCDAIKDKMGALTSRKDDVIHLGGFISPCIGTMTRSMEHVCISATRVNVLGLYIFDYETSSMPPT